MFQYSPNHTVTLSVTCAPAAEPGRNFPRVAPFMSPLGKNDYMATSKQARHDEYIGASLIKSHNDTKIRRTNDPKARYEDT